ncbi:MAG: alpha/beta hydrolase [Bacteroidota bacterium]
MDYLHNTSKVKTRYAKSGKVNIAYQVVGTGTVDLVYIPGWVSNIDMMWKDPRISHFLSHLSKFTRLILFDKRGTGLSDRVNELASLQQRMDDIRCVMDAADSGKAILFGHSEGGVASCLFAATYPERTHSLITFGIWAKRKYSRDYPWAPTDEERQVFYQMIEQCWGDWRNMDFDTLMPSMVHDEEYCKHIAAYLRSSASPRAALALAKMNTEADVTHILGSIKAPTLILHRTNDLETKVGEARYLAEHIPNATLVELPGEDHLFWVGDIASVLGAMEEFIVGKRPKKVSVQYFKSPKSNLEHLMSKNFKRPLSISEFAALSGRSLSSFKRDFKKILW